MPRQDRHVAESLLHLEPLEESCVPVQWPVAIAQNQVAELLGTYGQYQARQLNELEKTLLGLDPTKDVEASHVHEGLDIKAPAGTLVRAVKTGWVKAVYHNPATPVTQFSSFVVIRDVVTDANGTPVMENGKPKLDSKGWNYKHVLPDMTVKPRQLVMEGDPIGAVGPYPGMNGYGDHVHLDRGLASATDPAKNKTRDETMLKTGPYQAANRAAATDPMAASLVEGFRWQYAPTLNPLGEFAGVAGVVDEVAPTVTDIAFRPNIDDGTKALIKDPDTGQPLLQRVRDTPRYFKDTVTVGNDTYVQLGKYAVATSAKGTKNGPKDLANARIDFVASAFDTFGSKALPSTQKLNPASFQIRVSGAEAATQAANSGWIRSFDFGKVPSTQGVNDFFSIDNTRVLYENDTKHNSVMVPTDQGGDPAQPYWYILTNTPNAELPANKQPDVGSGLKLMPGNRGYYWNSLGKQNTTFHSGNAAEATNNATAAFPDGLYNVTVRATDLSGNAGEKSVKIMLNNWTETVKMSKAVYGGFEHLVVAGGEQYRANQSVNIYLLRGRMSMTTGTSLAGEDLRAIAATDSDGNLSMADLGTTRGGVSSVVADTNGDGEYTAGLDAYTVVWVLAAPGGAVAGGIELTSSVNPSSYSVPVTFTATAYPSDPGNPPPDGQVAFYDGSTFLGIRFLSGGVATLTVPRLETGDRQITAHYVNDVYPGGDFFGSLTQVVTPNRTAISLSASNSVSDHYELETFTAVVSPSGTSVTAAPTGNVDFYADGEFVGSAPVEYYETATFLTTWLERGALTITAQYTGDDLYEESSQTIAHVVRNNPPTLAADAITTTEAVPITVGVLKNDYDEDADELTLTGVSQPAHGTASVSNGRVVYTPAPGFVGTETLTYTVEDGLGGTASANVTIRVLAANTGTRVFADTNGNGVQDSGEVGLPFVVVPVIDAFGNVFGSARTDESGYYQLPPDLPVGDYRLRFLLPPGLENVPFSPPDQGDDATDSDVDASGESAVFTYDPAQGWPDIDAGVILDPADPAYSYLFG